MKNLKKILVSISLLISISAIAAAPVIWDSGDYAKFLTALGFKFNDGKSVFTLSVDPSAGGGVAANIGSIGFRNNAGTGQAWLKTGVGDTSWTVLATGTAAGDVTGPSSSVDNELVLFDGTSGKIIKRAAGNGAVSVSSGVVTQGTLSIANGGTSQTTAANAFNALSPMTTKGDIISYSTAPCRIGVGSDGQTLTADSGQTCGVKWSAAGSGDVVGPASSTDNAFARFDSTTGKLLQNSTATLSDAGVITSTVASGNGIGLNLTTTATASAANKGAINVDYTMSDAASTLGDSSAFHSLAKAGVNSVPLVGFYSGIDSNGHTGIEGFGMLLPAATTDFQVYYGLYIAGASSGTVLSDNYALYVADGASYFNGSVKVTGLSTGVVTNTNGTLSSEAQLAVARGGTGLASGTSGGILGFTGSGTIASSGALTANALVLGGGAGATPSALGSLGTTTTVLHGNAAGAPTFGSIVNADIANTTIDLTAKVTGVLPLANGGTNKNMTAANGGVVYTDADSQEVTAAGTDGQLLRSAGAAAPAWFTDPVSANYLQNVGLSASISSNTLVIALKQADGSTDPSTGTAAVKIGYRSSTATSGGYTVGSYTGATSITLAATDSIGATASVNQVVYVYSIDDTADELGVSYTRFNDGEVKSATALSGSAETDATLLYATSAHTSKPIRLIGRVNATWSNPNWGTITDVVVGPLNATLHTQTFTADGSWVAPKNVHNAYVAGRGGSGGGGGATNNATAASGGGGGGAASYGKTVAVTPGTTYTITIGAAGSAGGGGSTSGSDGGDGTASTFGSLLTFPFGHGGPGGNNRDQSKLQTWAYFGSGSGGHGGVGKTATTAQCGEGAPSAFGAFGTCAGSLGGGGGGGGDGAGGNGGNGNTNNPGQAGSAGTLGGGGGGGGYASSTGNGGAGGAGTTGQITVTWVE